MIVEGCDILLDVNQVFVRQGKKQTGLEDTFRSCFPKDTAPSFPRRSVDFPQKSSHIFTSEDSEENMKYRSQRSNSTVSYLQREPPPKTRRRLSSLRQSSLGNGSSFPKQNFNVYNAQAPLSPPLNSRNLECRRLSEGFRGNLKKNLKMGNDSFDEGEENEVSSANERVLRRGSCSSLERNVLSPDIQEEKCLTPVHENMSLESGSSGEVRVQLQNSVLS